LAWGNDAVALGNANFAQGNLTICPGQTGLKDATMDASTHAAARDDLIERLTSGLAADERVAAAWLAGSLGRGDGDDWSDIDLWLAVEAGAADELCAPVVGSSPRLSPARRELVAQFGELVVEGENGFNAGPGGVAFNVIYRDPTLVLDGYLVPAEGASRQARTKLLFDRRGVPLAQEPVAAPADQAHEAAVEVAMFWYFVAPVVKAIRRGDALQVQVLLQRMRQATWRAERMTRGEPTGYRRWQTSSLALTVEEQEAELRGNCETMLKVMPLVEAAGGPVPREPMRWVERLLG
jgi:predicted nucleotidyltransferase